MKLWKLVAANNLRMEEAPLPKAEENLIRVRVSKVLLNGEDAALFAGNVRVRYPLIPGRYAVGFVTDEGNALFPKGTRVLLHGYRPVPTEGTERRDFDADDYFACGRTIDGFLSEFVLVSPNDMTALPPPVSDERGLLLHQVAAAREIVEKLGAQKGQHFAVVGADLVGILVCQLLIWQQAAPILVDANKGRLDFARTCGVYYTVPADDATIDTVASITGGRLAQGSVYIATAAGNSTDLPFRLTAREGSIVYFATSINKVSVDLEAAFRKHLAIRCVSHDMDYIETAINLMANKAVDPTRFHANEVHPDGIEELLTNYPLRPDRDVDEINFVNLLQ
ncbi:MAG: zinc-binding dehydrogenase [Clostridia bacterium]|nr:zinc-binding dehydrogenase [Clostridia bacterium]